MQDIKFDSEQLLELCIGMNSMQFFIHNLPKNKKFCIFGFGEFGKKIYQYMLAEGLDIIIVCDNNWKNFNSDIMNIISPEQATKQYGNIDYVITSTCFCYEMEMQLKELGVSEENIHSYNQSVITKYRSNLNPKDYKAVVSAQHYGVTGIYPNLDSPKTFNEKIMVNMIMEQDRHTAQLTDKFRVRHWIETKIGDKYLVPIIGDWDDVESIDFEALPAKYVLKTNHGCGWNIISDGTKLNSVPLIKCKINDWMHTNYAYYAFEMQYSLIKPHILCEQYIENMDHDVNDYKVFCFHGKPQYIMYLCERKKGLKMAFFDLEWKRLPFVYSYPAYVGAIERPKCLDKLLELSEILAQGINQVRVDWYVLNDGSIKFGEMTFTSAAGHALWNPAEWDTNLGKLI